MQMKGKTNFRTYVSYWKRIWPVFETGKQEEGLNMAHLASFMQLNETHRAAHSPKESRDDKHTVESEYFFSSGQGSGETDLE